MKFDDKKRVRKRPRKVLAIMIVLICATGVLFLIRGCRDRSKVQITAPGEERNNYDILVEDWNRGVVNNKLGKFYYLPDTDSKGVIKKLNNFSKSFSKCRSQELQNELKTITQGKKYSFFVFYADLLKTYCVSDKVNFNPTQSSDQIRALIKKLTKQDRINTKAIAIIASLNDPCLYLYIFQNALYEQGMSKNIQSCKDIILDKAKYPVLFALISKGK
jgi:hypothetical protein